MKRWYPRAGSSDVNGNPYVRVSQLRPGDVLSSGQRVTWIGRTITTPGRKLTVELDGVRVGDWWRDTVVTIKQREQ